MQKGIKPEPYIFLPVSMNEIFKTLPSLGFSSMKPVTGVLYSHKRKLSPSRTSYERYNSHIDMIVFGVWVILNFVYSQL